MKTSKLSFAAALIFAAAFASALDGREVMVNADNVKKPKFTHALVTMELISKDGTSEVRSVEEWGRDQNDLSDIVIAFKSPATIKDSRFLIKENDGKDDDKWIFLPALQQVRRIAASEGSKDFFGTDATYDDMSSIEVDDRTHELLADNVEKNGYKNCAQVKSAHKDQSKSQYLYTVSWVEKDTWVPIYAEMYDKKGKLLKTLEVKKLEVIEGYPTPLENLMTNVQTGHKTRMSMDKSKLVFDKPIPPAVFTQNFLKTGKVGK